jgi:hypothetical protein
VRWLTALLLIAGCYQATALNFEGINFDAPNPPGGVMAEWYRSNHLDASAGDNEGFIEYVGEETVRAAKMLGIDDQVPTMLCMWHRESNYHVKPGDDGKSFGVTQTLLNKEEHWRTFWKERGVELGTLYDPSTQVFFGVAEFSECLKQANGDEFDAVRRYNGSGWKARRYARRVFFSRKLIYGYPLPSTPAAKKAYAERRHHS